MTCPFGLGRLLGLQREQITSTIRLCIICIQRYTCTVVYLTVLIINVTVFCNFESAVFIVQFQKKSIPTLRKVNGNSKGEGISKNDFVKRKVHV